MDVIDHIIQPTLDKMGVRYEAEDNLVHFSMNSPDGMYAVLICAYSMNLNMRIRPHIYAVAGSSLLELILGLNYEMSLLKWARDRRDGELVLNLDIPLRHGSLDEASFGLYFVSMLETFKRMLPELQKVRWGSSTPEEAMIAILNLSDEGATDTAVERDVREVLEQIEWGDDD